MLKGMDWLVTVLLLALKGLPLFAGRTVVDRSERCEPVTLNEFKSSLDMEVIHFSIPQAAHLAAWRLRAVTGSGCDTRNVSVALRHGTYAIMDPRGIALPDDLYLPSTMSVNSSILSDNQTVFLNVSNPRPGDWFLGAVITDASRSINPGGLSRKCTVRLYSSASYVLQKDVIFVVPEIHDYQNVKLYQEVRGVQYYKFYVPSDTWIVNVTVSKCSPSEVKRGALCPILLAASAESLPSLQDPSTMWKNCSEDFRSTTCTFEFMPREEAWHFLKIESFSSSVEVTLQIGYHSCSYQAPQQSYMMMTELSPRQICASLLKNVSQHASLFRNVYYLIQRSQPDYFSKAGCLERTYLERVSGGQAVMNFSYSLPTEGDSDVHPYAFEIPVSMNPHLFSFDLHSITDIGGTLVVGLSLEGRGYGRPLVVPETTPGIKVFGCLAHDQRAEMKADGWCSSGLYLQVNSSFESATRIEALVPFPPPGRWYLTLMAQCYDDEGARGYSPVDSAACRDEAALANIVVTSGPCEKGSCQNGGRCRLRSTSGYIFSSCQCINGYRGFFCNDGSDAVPQYMQLLSVLLLTLSNLMFIPAIGIAVVRRFFTEGVVYLATMASSTLYHACDQSGRYAFCLVGSHVLQAMDFYCGLLSFWVTLLAMASLPWAWKSSFHLLGAVGILMAVQMDRESVWAFVIPTAFAALVLATAWIIYCRLDKRCYPGKRFFLLGILPGLAFVGAGLAIFAFLETDYNYFWTHSAWHVLVAASICFLLPFANATSLSSSSSSSSSLPGPLARERAYGIKTPSGAAEARNRAGGDGGAEQRQTVIQAAGGESMTLTTTTTATAAAATATLKRSQNRNKRGSVNHGHVVGEEGEERGMETWLAQSPSGNKTIVSVSQHPGAVVEGQSMALSASEEIT